MTVHGKADGTTLLSGAGEGRAADAVAARHAAPPAGTAAWGGAGPTGASDDPNRGEPAFRSLPS